MVKSKAQQYKFICGKSEFKVEQADTWWKRLCGLMFRKSLPASQALWLLPCPSIHTIGMRFPIDVVFLNKQKQVIAWHQNVRPFRFKFGGAKAYSTIELPAGSIAANARNTPDKAIAMSLITLDSGE